MIQKVKEYIEKYNLINIGDHIVIGVSGGPDSMCLLSVLDVIYGDAIHLHVVHINHGIRESADQEATFVKQTCEKMGIPVKIVKVDALGYAKEYGLSTEEAGRILRYQIFESEYKSIDVNGAGKSIAVAHNMNDNAETMLLNMFRGSSLGGLVGIRAKREHIIRPLLAVARDEIEKYLEDRDIGYCIDESNHTDDYARNRVRHHILPVATEAINRGAVRNMMELSSKVDAAKDYIDSQVDAFMESVCEISEEADILERSMDAKESHKKILIKSGLFEKLHPYIKTSLLYKSFGMVSGRLKDVESKHIDMISTVFDMDISKRVDLPYGIQALRVSDGVLLRRSVSFESENSVCEPVAFESSDFGNIEFNGYKFSYRTFDVEDSDQLVIAQDEYKKWFDYNKIDGTLLVRTRNDGDYLTINEKGNTQKLKNYFINAKVSQEERDKIPLIADGNHILWVIGGRISSHYKIDKSTKKIIEIVLEKGRV